MNQPASQDGTSAVLVLTGDFDLFSRSAFLAEIEHLSLAGVTHLVINMARIQFLSSAGFAALIKAQKFLNRKGGALTVSHPSEAVRATFEALGLCGLLSVFDDNEQARRAMGS